MVFLKKWICIDNSTPMEKTSNAMRNEVTSRTQWSAHTGIPLRRMKVDTNQTSHTEYNHE